MALRDRVKQPHTILLTYDRVEQTQVDLGIDRLRELYASNCINERFMRWIPERFAMQVDMILGDLEAQRKAVEIAIIALYSKIPKSTVTNMQIWIDGEPVHQISQSYGQFQSAGAAGNYAQTS